MLGLIQAALQTEASASRAAQQLLAEEDQAAASAAAKKAKKKQRQKARKQLTHNELASVEEAPVKSTAAPALVTTSTQAVAEHTHSHQLTDAHTSAAAAAATAVVDVHSSLEALQPLDSGKAMGSAASSQGQASKDEQHDAAFLHSLFCCPILKVSLQHLLRANAASKHQNPVAVSYTSLPDAHICTLTAWSTHPAVSNHNRCMSSGCLLFDGKYTAWQYKCLSVAGQAAMIDPVIAADGHTYERVAIDQWLQHHHISPVRATDRVQVLVTCSAKMLAEDVSSTSRQLLHDPVVISRGHTVLVCVHLQQ